MTVQFPSQQELDQARLMSTAPLGFQLDPRAFTVNYNLQEPVRSAEETRTFYREYVNRGAFYLRYLPDGLDAQDGLALACWHLATGDHKFIVLVSESPDVDRTVIDSFLERIEPHFGHVIEGRRIKVVGTYTTVGLHGAKHLGKRPDLIIVNGSAAFYEDERCERWVDHVVKGALGPEGSLVMLGCPVPEPMHVEVEIPQDPEGDIKMVVDGTLFLNGKEVGKMESLTMGDGFVPVLAPIEAMSTAGEWTGEVQFAEETA